MTTTPRLTAAAVTRVIRKATGSDLFTSRTEPSIGVVRVSQRYAVAGALASADTRDRREARARLAAAALMQAGYEVARTGDRLTVTLPEPTSAPAEVSWAEAQVQEAATKADAAKADALAADAILAAVPATTPATVEHVIDMIRPGMYCACGAGEFASYNGFAKHRAAQVRKSVAATRTPDATRPGASLGIDRILAAANAAAPVVDAAVEQDVASTADERVTVSISARELRAGDEVVDSLGARQYAAFDTDAGTHIADGRLVRVWTAIRDQEAGLPPVITVPAERELLVLRPLSAEGRELLAALDRTVQA